VLKISVLGELAIEADGAPVAAPESRRARLLLGWLALHPGRHARTELAARLRPDVLDESARSSLRQAAWALRQALGDALEADRGTIGLAGDGIWVDAREFERFAHEGRGEEALALVRGPLLSGLDEEWVLDARTAQQQAEDALLERMEGAAGDPATAVAIARARVERDPLSEEAHRALMTRQGEAGDRAAALVTYQRLAERLRRELGVAPSRVTRELAASLREEDLPSTLPPRLAAATRTPFVGRRAELERAMAAWREVAAGSLRALLLAGEPGMGKTRLAAELARRANESGATVLHGRFSEDELAPYQGWLEALDQAGIAFVPAAEGARLELFRSIADRLEGAARKRPLVIVLDDIHWADRSSLLLLVHLVSSAAASAILLVATYRDTEAGPALERALADLHREPGVERQRLRGMGDRDVAALVETLAGSAADDEFERAVSEETGGSPFFVGELIRHLRETGRPLEPGSLAAAGVPESVGEVLDSRLARLGEGARETLAVAAVAGAEFRTDVVASAAGIEEAELGDLLDAAVAAGLVAEPPSSPARYAFPHALVRDALYGRLGTSRRARLHAAVGRSLERLSSDPREDAAALAHHFHEAGMGAAALQHGEAAARRAMDMLAWEEAADHAERALAHAGAPGDSARLLLLLGEARGRAGAADQARETFARAVQLARELDSGTLLAEAALGAGGVGVTLVDVDTALIALLEEALEELPPDEQRLRARLLARLATELYYSGDSGRERARELTMEAVAIAKEAGDAVTLTEALVARRVALWDPGHLDERFAVDEELIELGRRHREAELHGRHWRYVDLAELGDMAEARAELDRYEALTAELRMPAFAWYVPLWRAALAIFEGRFDEAEALADEAYDAGHRAEDANAEIFRLVQRGAILIEQERLDEFEMLDEIEERLESESASVAWMTGMAWFLASQGDRDEARSILAHVCDDELARLPHDANRQACLAELAEAACLLGERDYGAAIERALEPLAERNIGNARAISFYGSAHFFLAKLAELRGDRETAARRYASAVARNRAFGAGPRTALARRELERLTGVTAR
jgi:DNA-binding SARP family transcriptional activator/DNA polymerase III delta prime subunit